MPHQAGHGSVGTQVPATKAVEAGASSGATGLTNLSGISTVSNIRNYSNMHGYGGVGTGSYDFSTMSDLTGSGGGGGYDESLELDSGIPVTKRNPMLRKNVVGYHSGGRVNPYKYNNRALRYAQGGVTPQQESNDGAMWANMAARLGQKNADIALLQTQKIIQGNGKGNPYQMPEQRTRFDNGGQVDWKNPNINMDNLVSDAYQEMFPGGISFAPRNRTNEMANQMSQSMGLDKLDLYKQKRGMANQGMKMKKRYTQGGRF